MIHIATVHHNTDKWIEMQAGYFKRCIEEPYRVYACLTGIERLRHDSFYYVADVPGGHAEKLNFLADRIVSRAAPEDLIIFIDGDAFPICKSIIPFIREKIARHKLIAVRRDENYGDPQPHPSFCATTAGFWKDIGGDWQRGYHWVNTRGQVVCDVGGKLLLKLKGIDWLPLIRTGKNFFHPLFFGIYGDIVYHHGAGFRDQPTRADLRGRRVFHLKKVFAGKAANGKHYSRVFFYVAERSIELFLIYVDKKNRLLKGYVYNQAVSDRNFFLRFLKKGRGRASSRRL
ncbi:hypothetical protein ACFL42_01310 [Candidatus Omnitrophota bacterium]